MNDFEWTPTVLSNTGCQFRFLPLFEFGAADADSLPDLSQTWWDDVDAFPERHRQLAESEDFLASIDELKRSIRKTGWEYWKGCTFVQNRLAVKLFREARDDGGFREHEIFGMELAVETTAPGERFNECGFLLDRKAVVGKSEQHAPPFPSVYHRVPDGEWYPPNGAVYKTDVGGASALFRIGVRIGFKSGIAANGVLGAHLVIDVGNTRTCALFLRDEPTGMIDRVDAIRTNCTPVMLNLPTKTEGVTKQDAANADNGIVSSSIMLHQTEFDADEPKVLQRKYVSKTVKKFWGRTETFNEFEELRIPTMFVRYSPVLLGREALGFMRDSRVEKLIKQGLQIQQSSPKRYFADGRKTNLAWSMIPNDLSKEDKVNANKLRSPLLYWMNERGAFVDPDETSASCRPLCAPTMPNYPRSATFVWMLVGILERAWEQCNRLADANSEFTPYSIQDVVVTYPSGWTRDEINCYRQRCREAVQIFERTNFSTRGQIRLDMDVDEAVASQLPFVFSEIHKHGDNATGWVRLAGKTREDGRTTFRMMSLDVGGGTSDISVVEYECLPTQDEEIDIQPKLLFRDGYAEAGDELMRRIVCQIVFPAIKKADPRIGDALRRHFTGKVAQATKQIERANDLKLVIVPLAIQIMSALASGAPSGKVSFSAARIDSGWVELVGRLHLPEMNESELRAMEIEYDVDEVNGLIRKFFENALRNVARIAEKYDVDAFFMSGKTSELPELHRLACENVPLTQDRIVTARNYCAGDWYPFVKTDEHGDVAENTVKDAKSITAVGAALNFLLHSDRVHGWKIEKAIFAADYSSEWGYLEAFRKPNGRPFAFDEKNEVRTLIDGTKTIARRMGEGAFPSAVYRLQRRNVDDPTPIGKFTATLRRGVDEETKAEYLELASLERDGVKADASQYELAVCQGGELFWQDSGCVDS